MVRDRKFRAEQQGLLADLLDYGFIFDIFRNPLDESAMIAIYSSCMPRVVTEGVLILTREKGT